MYAAGHRRLRVRRVALARARDSDDPPGGGWDDPFDEQPPPGPDGEPFFDWPAFERDLRAYAGDREREPAAIDR